MNLKMRSAIVQKSTRAALWGHMGPKEAQMEGTAPPGTQKGGPGRLWGTTFLTSGSSFGCFSISFTTSLRLPNYVRINVQWYKMKEEGEEGINERTNEQTNDQANDQTKERPHERTNERPNDRTNEQTNEQGNEGTSTGTIKWTNERTNERTKEQTYSRLPELETKKVLEYHSRAPSWIPHPTFWAGGLPKGCNTFIYVYIVSVDIGDIWELVWI